MLLDTPGKISHVNFLRNTIVHQLYFIGAFLQVNPKNEYFWSWKVDMQNIFHNIQVTLEESWDYLNLCMEWLTVESSFLVIWQSGWLNQSSFNINYRCLCIINMYQTEKGCFSYLKLIIVPIGRNIKILENGLWILYERDYM